MPSPLVGASADGGDFLAIDDRNEGLHPGGGCAGSRNSDSSYLRSEEKIDGQRMCKDLRAINRVSRKALKIKCLILELDLLRLR
jgi:hypothetical protein